MYDSDQRFVMNAVQSMILFFLSVIRLLKVSVILIGISHATMTVKKRKRMYTGVSVEEEMDSFGGITYDESDSSPAPKKKTKKIHPPDTNPKEEQVN